MAEAICCPEFEPAPWDNKTFDWKDKRFIKAKVATLFFMPLNFASVMRRLMKEVEAAGAAVPEYLALSDHVSPWRMDVCLAVDKEVPGAESVILSGKFFSRVYEGSFKDSRLWCNDFQAVSTEKKLSIKKWYMWYTTCPKCAKKYGKNYVVIIGRVE
jgi:hypothetical protein